MTAASSLHRCQLFVPSVVPPLLPPVPAVLPVVSPSPSQLGLPSPGPVPLIPTPVLPPSAWRQFCAPPPSDLDLLGGDCPPFNIFCMHGPSSVHVASANSSVTVSGCPPAAANLQFGYVQQPNPYDRSRTFACPCPCPQCPLVASL